MNKYSSASSLRSAKLETSFGVNDEEPKTHVIIQPGGPAMSLPYNGMVTPGSISSNQSGMQLIDNIVKYGSNIRESAQMLFFVSISNVYIIHDKQHCYFHLYMFGKLYAKLFRTISVCEISL